MAQRYADLTPSAVTVHNLIKWHRLFRSEYVTVEELATEARLTIPELGNCLRELLACPERRVVA
jgi:hypothetical protein